MVGGGETGWFPIARSRKRNVLLTRQLAVDERVAGAEVVVVRRWEKSGKFIVRSRNCAIVML